tara:strand:+ start:452 stop:739 length:288 start_codon:yes stop_codon:yes gene_type:complete
MNLFDAVPYAVYTELGHEVDDENINNFEVQRVFKIVIDLCDNFQYSTITPKNKMMILRMVRNAIGLMVSDDADEREVFKGMVDDLRAEGKLSVTI